MMEPIRVGTRKIGNGQPCFIAAEIGINHNGDMALAKAMIDAAVATGADAVKFQTYKTDDFLSDRTLMYTYESQGKTVTEAQYDMFKRCELSAQQLSELCRYCESRGIIFFSTPTSKSGIDDVVSAGALLLKNGSDYLTNLPLIRDMAQTGLPTVLSTGMASLEDIEDAVGAFEQAGGRDLLILHCTSSYPTPPGDVNLLKIVSLREKFNYHIGFSDHSYGTIAAIGAVALGACFVEKHFTLDRNLPGPDHVFSSTPEEFTDLVQAIRTVEKNLGRAEVVPTASEEENRLSFRLSCVAARDLPAGHTVTEGDIVFRRPGTGLPPKMAPSLVGKTLVSPLHAGACFEA